MRPARVLAVARRDLRIEFAGRKGWALPLIAASVLLSAATAPPIPREPMKMGRIAISGDVPPELLRHPRLFLDDRASLVRFEAPAQEGEPWRLHGLMLPDEVRIDMDAWHPPMRTEVVSPEIIRPPDRSLLLAMVAASVLTGAISQSLPGERSNRTLETLLVAGITAIELVVGKWLAWTAFGGGAAIVASVVAVALGRQDAGWWMLATPMVSAGTVALGLWLVRQANDVVGGATVALRVLPAALIAAGIVSWLIGDQAPLLGAAIPLGGALIAAGAFWTGPVPVLVAVLSTGLFSAALIRRTAQDLADIERIGEGTGAAEAAFTVSLGVLGSWFAVLGPLVWALGGNEELVETIGVGTGALASAYGMFLLLVLAGARGRDVASAVGLAATGRAPAVAWGLAAVGALGGARAVAWVPSFQQHDLAWQVWARQLASFAPPDATPGAALFIGAVGALFWNGRITGLLGAGPAIALQLGAQLPWLALLWTTARTGDEPLLMGVVAATILALGLATAHAGNARPALAARIAIALTVWIPVPELAVVGVLAAAAAERWLGPAPEPVAA
jgi:ABC-type Na+ efflux pump permease subunit